jgi:very-short-patch-repair endonuclease
MNQDQMRERLENIRKGLLDFSMKNQLLSFKYPERYSEQSSAGMVRMIDGATDVIYQKLREGDGGLAIKPFIGDWKEEHFDFRPTGRVTEFLRSPKYRDQLLSPLKPESLEKALANMAKNSRSEMAESGVNTLYLVFGYLEWSKSSTPEASHLAPILMAPVSLRKEKLDGRTRINIYSVELLEGSADVNPMLGALLARELNLAPPHFSTEDGAPEEYFRKLQETIGARQGWRARNQVTLTRFPIDNTLMFRDLDPLENPTILQRPLVRRFLEGRSSDDDRRPADYQVDDPEIDRDLPPQVFDADSSQLCALVDVARGKNLVIEGPPGAGKSQTIANLIAATLAKGKTVLFVAGKEAALDVVARRLDNCGLSPFCLEIYSHKTHVRDLLDSLKRREALSPAIQPGAYYVDRKAFLNKTKRRLTEYANIINKPYGKYGQTIYQAIWLQQRIRQELTFNTSLIEAIFLPGAEELTFEHVEHLKQSAEIFGQHLSKVSKGKGLKQNPWYGVSNWRINAATEQEMVITLQSIVNAANQLQKQIDDFNQESGQQLVNDHSPLQGLFRTKGELPIVPLELIVELVPKLIDPNNREKLRRLIELLERRRELLEAIQRQFLYGPDLTTSELATLRSYCLEFRRLEIDWRTIGEFKEYNNQLMKRSVYFESVSAWFHEICSRLGLEAPYSAHHVSLFVKAADLTDGLPWGSLHLRSPQLERDGVVSVLSQACGEAEALRIREAVLSRRIDLKFAPSRELLVRYVEACSNAGPLSLTKRDFRLARRAWRGMDKRCRKVLPQQMVEDFRELIHFEDDLKQFNANPLYRQVLGDLFDGLRTSLERLLPLAVWYLAVKRTLGINSEAGSQIAFRFFNAPIVNIQALYEFLSANKPDREGIRKIFDEYSSFVNVLPPQLQQAANENLDLFNSQLGALALQLELIVQFFEECHLKPETPVCQIPELLDYIQELLELRDQIVTDESMAALLDLPSIPEDLDTVGSRSTIDFVDGVLRSSLSDEMVAWLLTSDLRTRISTLRSFLDKTERNYSQLVESKEFFARLARVNDLEEFFHDIGGLSVTFGQIARKAEKTIQATAELSVWLAYLRAKRELIQLGLEPLVKLAEEGDVPIKELYSAASYIYQNSLLFSALEAHPLLSTFDGIAHNRIRDDFAKLDEEIIKSSSREIVQTLLQQKTPVDGKRVADTNMRAKDPEAAREQKSSDYTEMRLIRYLMSQSRPRMKVRQLVERASETLLKLKPCFMMSPLSVAQYLPSTITFDLVVIDEASQLTVEKSLGAIARGTQIVIVGDRNQLPPSNFFKARIIGGGWEDEDDSMVDGAESVLDRASALFDPPRKLTWHYRSEHQDLIAFSNQAFYNGKLIVFPSPFPANEERGVKFVLVQDGIYGDKRNENEARRVVTDVIAHLRDYPEVSLGVIAMNMYQKDLIDALLEESLKKDGLAKQTYDQWDERGEEVFVKNLENVQGDERDAIFISAIIGRDSSGSLPMNRLGLLNQACGHRRLNVLVSRARKRTVIYSSVLPDDLKISGNSSYGARMFKDYLSYALRAGDGSNTMARRKANDDFQLVLCRALKIRGYESASMIGVESYWIDVAVIDPDNPDQYILGIECDGPLYQAARSARDRDRLRPKVLSRLGWRLHRIWSADWLRNREWELDRIVRHIERLRSTRPVTVGRDVFDHDGQKV